MSARDVSTSGVNFHMDDFYGEMEAVELTTQPTSSPNAVPVAAAPAAAPQRVLSAEEKARAGSRAERMERCTEISQSCGMLIFILYPAIVGILMALYYLFVRYDTDEVYAFGIIWLVFVTAMISGLTYTWQIRKKEEKIHEAELKALDEKAREEIHVPIVPAASQQKTA